MLKEEEDEKARKKVKAKELLNQILETNRKAILIK